MTRTAGCDWWYGALSMCVGAMLALGGCRQGPPAEPNSVSNTAERGPFVFTIEIKPAKAWIGDPLTIDLRVQTPDDYVVQFPGAGELGELEVRQVGDIDMRPGVEGGLVWRQTITAESLSSGVVEVPPLAVKYGQKPATADLEPIFDHELESQPLQIEVRSALTTQDSVIEPRDITGTLTPPREPRSPWFYGATTAAIIAGVVGLVAAILWLRRLTRRPAPPILPEVWALRTLAELEGAGLIDSGRAKEFYYRLSEIVRVYIELKFGLAAPEMTTEEFLNSLARNRGALLYQADRLCEFLQACDLVKYAAFTPGSAEAQRALGSARAFIDATAAEPQRQGRAAAPAAWREPGGHAA